MVSRQQCGGMWTELPTFSDLLGAPVSDFPSRGMEGRGPSREAWQEGAPAGSGPTPGLRHQSRLLRIFFFNYLFYFFWLRWVFVAARGLSLVAVSRATLRCGARASHCGGFSRCRARALCVRASVVVACRLSSCGSRALEHRLSSCGAQA